MKRCSKCKKVKPISEFYKNKKAISGLYSWCKSCCCEYQQSEREYKQRYQSQIKVHRSLSVGLPDALAYCEACFEE